MLTRLITSLRWTGGKPWWRLRSQWSPESMLRRGSFVKWPLGDYGDLYEMGMQFLRKRVATDAAGTQPVVLDPNKHGMAKLPALYEFLAAGQWDDGTDRETGTMLIWFDTGAFHCMLRDRDGGMVSFGSADGFSRLLDRMDEAIRGDTLEWRPERSQGTKRGRSGRRG